MAAQSRHASQSTAHDVHKERDSQPPPNEYEVVRDRRKKALHDRVELALLEAGFGEAAKLRSAFSGEGTTSTPAPRHSKPRPRRARVGASVAQERRRSARIESKSGAAETPAPTSEVRGKKVLFLAKDPLCISACFRELGSPSNAKTVVGSSTGRVSILILQNRVRSGC
jgi:hypothetical protein